jgi:hypothetical protein
MIALWIAVALLAVGLVFTALALAGAVRRIDELRREVTALVIPDAIEHPDSGLGVGSPAPRFEADRMDGGRFASSELEGRRHLVVFADPGCAGCHELVPDLVHARDLPPMVVSSGKGGDPWPDAWRAPAGLSDRVIVVRDADEAVANVFRTGFTPQVFVVDEAGAVAAQGPADSLDAVRALLREADAIQIVLSEPADG